MPRRPAAAWRSPPPERRHPRREPPHVQQFRHPDRQPHPRSRAAVHHRRPRRRQLRAGRQPALPAERRMAGADVVLQRRVLGRPRRERRHHPHQGLACDRHRPSRAAQLGDRRRREALGRRGRRRRGRPEPALGDRPDRAHRAHRRRRRLLRWRFRRRQPVVPAAPAPAPAHPTRSTATKSRSDPH